MVDELANGLLALGIRRGDAFALLGRTTLEWALFDFALGLVGAVGAPIYSSSSARDVRYVLEHSEAVGILVEDEEQLAKVEGFGGQDRKSTRLNSSHMSISYAVFCLKKKKIQALTLMHS